MPAFHSALTVLSALSPLAAPAPPPPTTQRSPLLYAWLTLQVVVLLLVVGLAIRYALRFASSRRPDRPNPNPSPAPLHPVPAAGPATVATQVTAPAPVGRSAAPRPRPRPRPRPAPGGTAPLLETRALGKRYGRHHALTDCELSIPPGRVIGLVGPNGAGKSTLLGLACGLIAPSSGSIRVLGSAPAANPAHLARVGFVAQDAPLYADLSVADHLRMGAGLNPGWDADLARRRIARIGLDPARRAGRLSGGQRAQLALTLAAAKRPDLLILDEPAAALDPLARHAFLEDLLEAVAELGAGAVLSSHALGDVERVCDYLVVLTDSRVQLAGDTEDLLAGHRRLVGTREQLAHLPPGTETVRIDHTPDHTPDRCSAVVRIDRPLPGDAPWTAEPLDLEDLVLAYMSRTDPTRAHTAHTAPTAPTAQEAHR